jgi:hypothetical protein
MHKNVGTINVSDKMTSDTEEDNWFEIYPKNSSLLVTLADPQFPMTIIPMEQGTRLPHAYRFDYFPSCSS